jgi:hypothetical protein
MSKAASTAPQRHFRFAPINGHQPTGPAGPFRAKAGLTFAIRVPLQSVRNEAAAQIISRSHRYKKATTWVAFLFYF